MNISDIWTVPQLKQFAKEKESHFFDRATMRFFHSRVSPLILHMSLGIVFITSEQFDTDSPRRYTIRLMENSGNVGDIGEFQQYDSYRDAKLDALKYQLEDSGLL